MLMTFYCTLLPDKVPSGRYQTPSLPFFAHYWQDGLTDIQQSARSLFGSAVARMTPTEIKSLVQYWTNYRTRFVIGGGGGGGAGGPGPARRAGGGGGGGAGG